MTTMFNVSEIYQIAISIEENGERFYRKSAEKFKDEKIKRVFNFLAEEEVNHKKVFSELLSQIKKYEPPESYPDEYFSYLKTFAGEIVFTSSIDKEIKEDITPAQAIDFAIKRELDSILYYTEIKNVVPSTQHASLDKIIEQERQHFVKLSNLKKEILKGGER